MPLWQIYHPPSTFTTAASKQSLAADITSLYTKIGLPPFYVVVNFIPLPAADIFVGGENPGTPFVRFVVSHVAVSIGDDQARMKSMRDRVGALLRPHVGEKGYNWELNIDETPRDLWVINGLTPPPFKSEAEQKWVELNRAVEWE